MTEKKKTFKTKKGVSLLIGIVLIAIISAFAMGISNVVTSSIRNTGNINNANMAYYAAEGALEQGLLLSAQQAGYNATPSVSYDTCPVNSTCPTATVKIQGTVPATQVNSQFIVPSPGTGTAGTNCNPLTAVTSGTFPYPTHTVSGEDSQGEGDAIDHPCNWNKIKVGENVTIPLYTTISDGAGTHPNAVTKNPADLGLTNLKLKIRTPCKNGDEMCLGQERFSLDTMNGDANFLCKPPTITNGCGDTTVSWQINAANKKGDKTYTMVPNDIYNTNQGKRFDNNSELYESIINDALLGVVSISPWSCEKYCVLYAKTSASPPFQRKGKDITSGLVQPISDFLRNEGAYASRLNTDDAIEKPILKLTVVHSLNDLYPPNGTIPYLEYQLTTNILTGTYTPADTSQTITAEGLSGTFKQVLEVKQAQESGLLEYVIQQ